MPQDEKRVGPIRLTAIDQEFTEPCRIIGVLWSGSTTAGDTVEIRGRLNSATKILWPARTDTTNTYLGAIWGPPGIHAPDGFRSAVLTSGEVFVYLAE